MAYLDGYNIGGVKMEQLLFLEAIKNRFKIKFFYNHSFIELDPYMVSDYNGELYVYGKISSSNIVQKFEINQISELNILKGKKFSPIIPIMNYS